MVRYIFSLMIICGSLLPSFAQNLDELLDQVDLKLRKDTRYLNIHIISFPNNRINATLQNIPRTNYREAFSFTNAPNVEYQIIFLKEAVGVDSLVLLYVLEMTNKTLNDSGFTGAGSTGEQIDTQRVLRFKDLYNMQKVKPEAYNTLYFEVLRYLREFPDEPPRSLLKINPDVDIKTSLGIASRDNSDFLNYMRANYIHWYPKPKIVQKSSARQKNVVVGDSIEYRIDASYTHITFSHKLMEFALGAAGVELSVDEKALNLLPYQQMSINGGFRIYVNLSDKKDDLDKSLMIDARLLARLAVNTSKLPTFLPFMGAGKPRLHLGSAAGIDATITRPFGMPFLNLYVMAGAAPNLADSPLQQYNPITKQMVAYYNTTALEASMSFYWNATETMTSRFRLDLGAGFYDIYEAEYTKTSAGKIPSKPPVKRQIQAKFQPVICFHFNFAPQGIDIYHAELKFYDSQLKVGGWLKLLELDGGHVIRFGGMYISPPIARKKRPWETDGGALLELRYRYGL
jgi:hypothetical protein